MTNKEPMTLKQVRDFHQRLAAEHKIIPPLSEAHQAMADAIDHAINTRAHADARDANMEFNGCYEKGRQDFLAGLSQRDNPYLVETDNSRQWDAGYKDAENMRDSWSDFENKYLSDGEGHAGVHVYEACWDAFEHGWPNGVTNAHMLALVAFLKSAK
jgi:hypothetical protein